ncbi:MAG: hypothetical protein AB1705_14920 [Verrucomicrobiota bacterium]
MRNVRLILFLTALTWQLAGGAFAAEYKLKDGSTVKGDLASVMDKGVVFKTEDGKFTARYSWDQFTEETLREFAKDPKAAKFAGLLVNLSADSLDAPDLQVPDRPRRPPVEVKNKPSPGRPHDGVKLMTAMTSGFGLFMSVILYLANIYAALEIAFFRNWPKWIPPVAAAVVPFVAPIVFLAMPTREAKVVEEEAPAQVEEEQAPELTYQEEMAALEATAAANAAAAAPKIPATQVFRRGESNLNRRFIETKCAAFFKVIPSDAERDMRVLVKTARGEFLATRISRITNTELTVQIIKDEASADEVIPLNDLFEIQIRHKDAQD